MHLHANFPHRLRLWLAFLGIACLALAVRLPGLGYRPMHTDEAVQAYLLGDLLSGKGYHYNPTDHHGPAPLVIALPLARLAGATDFASLDETMVRRVPAMTGAAAVFLFPLLCGEIGFVASASAALLWSLCPIPLYFSRYFIHETLFVAATLGLLACVVGRSPFSSLRRALLTGLFAGVMLGCKETAVLAFAAVALALLSQRFLVPASDFGKSGISPIPILAALFVFLSTVLLLFSWSGTIDLLGSLANHAHRATGEGHAKPFLYYAGLLAGTPSGILLLLLASAGGVSSFLGNLSAGRFFGFYALATTLIYSAIPYKTPWLALNIFLPLAVLAGIGISALWQLARTPIAKTATGFALLVTLGLVVRDSRRLCWTKACAPENPLAYAHTVDDLLRLPERMADLAARHPAGSALRVAVVAADAWPLPWYLRRFPNTGFWQPGADPGPADAYFTSPEAAETMPDRLRPFRPEFFGIRPEVLGILWTREEVVSP